MPHPQAKVHRMFELVEPIATVTFSEVPNEAFLALGMRNYWDGYFAGRAAPLGLAPAGVVHAVFYNFADGEVARHIPWVWGKTTPQEAIAVRERGSAAALRQMIGELADSPALVWGSPTSPPEQRSARRPRAERCTPGSGRSTCPRSRWPDSGTRRRCCGSTAGTATTPLSSPRHRRHRGPRPPRSLPRNQGGGVRPTPPPAQGTAGRCHRRAVRPRPRGRRRRVHRRRPGDQGAN